MLATLVASALAFGISNLPSQDYSLHTVELPDRVEKKTINGVEREVNVHYSVRFLPMLRTPDENANFRPYRDLNVRPEKPEGAFRMQPLMDLVDINDAECLSAFMKLKSFGAPDSIGLEIQTGLQRSLSRLQRSVKENEIEIDPMLEVKPGGWTHRVYTHLEHEASCSYEVTATWKADGKTASNRVAAGNIKFGSYWFPLKDPYVNEFTPDGVPDKGRQTAMGGITLQPQGMGLPIQIGLPPINGNSSSVTTNQYISDVNKENGGALIDEMQKQGYTLPQMIDILKQMAPEGTDMNRLNFPQMENPCASDFDAPPGTMWIPTNPVYQAMMTGPRYNLRSAGFDLFAMINGGPAQADRSMRVLCMNMEKKEPAAGVKYLPYRPSDPVVPMLAKRMDESNFRGAWDQARLWIYTDKATFEDIGKRLIGGVSPSAYLMALADVDWAGGLDEKMLKDAKFIKPEFMMGAGAPGYASNFLMNTLDELHSKKAGDWLKKNSKGVLQLVGPQSVEAHHEHLALVLKRLTLFNAPEDREAALAFMQGAQSELGILKGKLGSGRVSLYSGREKEVSAALALVKAGLLTPANDALAYVAAQGPGDANKKLAKELLGD